MDLQEREAEFDEILEAEIHEHLNGISREIFELEHDI